jgi:hypothetical protein
MNKKINSMTSRYRALEAELQIHEPKPMKCLRFLIDRNNALHHAIWNDRSSATLDHECTTMGNT